MNLGAGAPRAPFVATCLVIVKLIVNSVCVIKIMSTNSCLHTLLPPERNNEVLSKLRKPLKISSALLKNQKISVLPQLVYALAHFQNSK